jgi:hypothetical protein
MYENVCDKFGSLAEIGVEMKFGQKTACLDMATFLPNLGKKNHRFRDLEDIWQRFERSKYLVI